MRPVSESLQIREVVYEDGLITSLGAHLNLLEHFFLNVGPLEVHEVYLGTVQGFREGVVVAGFTVSIAGFPLAVGEFAVNVEDAAIAGKLLGQLYTEDGLAHIG